VSRTGLTRDPALAAGQRGSDETTASLAWTRYAGDDSDRGARRLPWRRTGVTVSGEPEHTHLTLRRPSARRPRHRAFRIDPRSRRFAARLPAAATVVQVTRLAVERRRRGRRRPCAARGRRPIPMARDGTAGRKRGRAGRDRIRTILRGCAARRRSPATGSSSRPTHDREQPLCQPAAIPSR
jgi:hypothetical protein